MEFSTLVFIVVGVVIVIAIIGGAIETNKKEQAKAMESKLKSLPDFNPTQQIIGCDRKSRLAVDEPRKKICLIINNGVSVFLRVINYKDIFSVE